MKTKNRLLASIFCLLMVVLCAVGFTACRGSDCTHQWGSWTTTTNATCTEAGVQERRCFDCGEIETTAIEALGHNWNEATCSAPKTCKTCSATEGTVGDHAYTVETVKAGALKSEADCTTAATYYKSCTCGLVSTNEGDTFTYGDPLGHVDEDKNHICDKACGAFNVGDHSDSSEDEDHLCDYGCGKTIGSCKDEDKDHSCDYGCGETFGEHSDSSTDKDHVCDYGCGAVLENCFDAEGDENHACDICGDADVSNHTYMDATCGAPATCSECGATITGSMLDHADENHDHICDNNCGKTDIGEHSDSQADADHVCDYGCGAILEECVDVATDDDHNCDVCGKADATIHDYTEKASSEATCNSAASMTYECNCGHEYTESIGAALGHDTNVAEGEERHVGGCEYVMVYTCHRNGCGEEVSGETIYKHNYVASISTPATCVAVGEKTFKCSACGYTDEKVEVIPANETGHNWESDNAGEGVRTDVCSICHATKTVMVSDTNTASSNASDLADVDVQLKVDENTSASIQLGQGVADYIGNQNITISAGVVDTTTLEDMGVSKEQLDQIGGNTVYDFSIESENGANVSDFNGNYVTITLAYELAEGEDVDSIAVWFIGATCQVDGCDKGENCVDAHKLVSIEATYNNGYVTFQTNHFSIYTVTRLTPAERCELYGHGYACQHVEGSCTKDSYDLYVCARCHDKQIENYVKADGHDYVSETHAATCVENGYVLYSCKDCDHSYRTKLNAVGHDWSVVDSKEATCAADGYVKSSCNNCGEEYTVTYAKLAHVYTDTVVPANCTSGGYTLHVCENCDYSYIDACVDALGHNYGAGTWTWEANGNKATLTLVCEHDNTHTTTLHVTSGIQKEVEKAACSNYVIRTHTATVEYNGVTYTDVIVIRQGNPQHTFSTELYKDGEEHWRECICGARENVSAHTFGNAITTKAATCGEAGESVAYCVCGATKVTILPATGNHNYVGDICTVCGKGVADCDHTELHVESLFSDGYDTCPWVLNYYTCECGEVKMIDGETSPITCDMEQWEENEYEDENGNQCETRKAVCSICGMEASVLIVRVEDGCTEKETYWYTFSIDGVVIIDNIYIEYSHADHNTTTATIDFSEYSACGSTLIVSHCKDCGVVENINHMDIQCDVSNMVEEEILNENGEAIGRKITCTCSVCGLTFIQQQSSEVYSACDRETREDFYVYYGEECIFEYVNTERQTAHRSYEYTHEAEGNDCSKSYKVIATCLDCGETKEFWSVGHFTVRGTVDLAQYTDCGGTITGRYCVVCGEFSYIENLGVKCDLRNGTQEEFVDENNVTHYRDSVTCPTCGLTFVQERWTVLESTCVREENQAKYIYSGEECLLRCFNSNRYADHQYEYEYELLGETCADGYMMKATCTVCGETDNWHSSGHDYEYDVQINLADYNGCAGTITCDRCKICGYISYFSLENVGCNLSGQGEASSYVDDDGITHTVATITCPTCGLRFVQDEWTIAESVCITRECRAKYIYSGEECLVEYFREGRYANHQYEYEYEMAGETCEDGYYQIRYCTVCGETDRWWNSGHNGTYRYIDIKELGFCGGRIEEYYCVACGTVLDSYFYNDYYCNWQYVGENAEGYSVYECYNCNGTKLTYSADGEKDEYCQYTHTEICILIINGEESYRSERYSTNTSHRYEYEFILNGASCEDGYTVTATCKDCGYSWQNKENYHNQFAMFSLEDVEGCCDDHYMEVRACPCGYYYYVDFNKSGLTYDDESQSYVCETCGVIIEQNSYTVEEGCAIIETNVLVVKLAGEVIYTYDREQTYANHNFVDAEVSTVDGVTMIMVSCDKCDTVYSSEIMTVELENHNGTYYYDYAFTPSESAVYTITGLADRDSYVTLYEMVGTQLYELSSNDDSAGNGQFRLSYNLAAEKTYVYRIRFYNSSNSGSISFTLTQAAETKDVLCRHNSNVTFSELLEGSKTCEDGALYGQVYTTCGCFGGLAVKYTHDTAVQDRIDLSEKGACYGEFVYYACACGKEHGISLNACANTWTDNEYYDEEGRFIHVEARTCSQCNLRYERSYYTVRDVENCTLTYYYTVVINVGGNLIAEQEYTVVTVEHDYEMTAALMGGEGSSCEAGVRVTYLCKVCGHEETYETYSHETLVKQQLDLSELGSVCGGYATVYECACGKRGSVSLEHSLCDRGGNACQTWINGAIEGWHFVFDGEGYFYHNAYVYTCAVTDPADKACAYKIRYATYWLKDADSCMAYQYQTWQFGYDEQNGTYQYEVTVKTGSSSIYHNYVNGSVDNHTKYDCPDCGSYYYENNYYDENGNHIKCERFISNTLDNGYDRYREYVVEYTTDMDGNWYTSREYYRTISSTGSESWYETLRTEQPYSGTFGENGREIKTATTYHDGRTRADETAYVYYQGYHFTIYSYCLETSGYWYRHDYTYNFEGECLQTTKYENSNGETWESTTNCCPDHRTNTVQNPTCTQDGEYFYQCVLCGKCSEPYTAGPKDHNWVYIMDGWYHCYTCGIKNTNGVSGSIIMEDLTEEYGDGEYYVVGYYAQNDVKFSKYISLLFGNDEEVAIWEGIEFIEVDGLRAYKFSKASVEEWAAANGYTDYKVKFSFVPEGSDGSFDYGVTFTDDTQNFDETSGDASFTEYIAEGETKTYTIAPTEDALWVFTSFASGDTYGSLYDAEGNCLISNDDGGQNNNFRIEYELKAGETYTIQVRWYSSETAGSMALLFAC